MPAASLMISAESLWANCGNNTRQEGVVRLWANRRPPGGNRGAQLPRWWIIFQPGFRLAVQKPASGKRARSVPRSRLVFTEAVAGSA